MYASCSNKYLLIRVQYFALMLLNDKIIRLNESFFTQLGNN